ncbi:carboxylesterase/lipase family protein [Rhizobium leguminosarum]|uniref:carboxylesterase/lipase family protein n=1 Tax=Rhizobium leguminosarum TaxID=384 RepID=UPI0016073479|nr:carboxylesterase family protein [Rhizobium leguminosarum]MDF9821858.1 para-nitrobenzyl esterase [Rhizobium leguminosarum]
MLQSDLHLPATEAAEIALPQGRLRGRTDGLVNRFLAIPFAAPPVGARRWRAPEPPQPWDGIRDAGVFAPVAPQPRDEGFFPGDPAAMPARPMDEDCLYLNVFAPSGPGPFPVLVWLHGGSQLIGGTSRPVYDGASFARNGIVCVTVGHRLGLLGLADAESLFGEDYRDTANLMLRDQLAALRWVQSNIAFFGGDPQRVTLGGESAGAKNVCVLTTTSAARGLFHAAISMSGGADTVFPAETATRFIEDVVPTGAAESRWGDAPWERILAVQEAVLARARKRFPLRPVYGQSLLPVAPIAVVEAGQALPVPMLLGSCRDECYPMVVRQEPNQPWADALLGHLSQEQMAEIEAKLAGSRPDLDWRRRRLLLLTAEEYELPSLRLARRRAMHGAPTWVYRYERPQPHGPFAGYSTHLSDLEDAWGIPAREVDLHGIVCDFVTRHEAPWEAFNERSRLAFIGDGVQCGSHPDRDIHALFEDWN